MCIEGTMFVRKTRWGFPNSGGEDGAEAGGTASGEGREMTSLENSFSEGDSDRRVQ